MRAQRYGSLPVARRVGGLADTIEDGVTGFLFDAYDAAALEEAAFRALAAYARPADRVRMMREAMHRDFGWERSVSAYIEVYRRAMARGARV
jgi:starch synthase